MRHTHAAHLPIGLSLVPALLSMKYASVCLTNVVQAMELEADRIRCFIKLLHMAAARPAIMSDIAKCTAANLDDCAAVVRSMRESKV